MAERTGDMQRVIALVEAAGAAGMTTEQITAALPREGDTIRRAACNAVFRGKLWNRRSRKLTLYFAHSVPLAVGEARMALLMAERDAAQAANQRAAQKRYEAKKRQEAAAVRALKREAWERERAERQRMAEVTKAAAKVRAADADAKPSVRHRTMATLKRGEHALSNALAARIRSDGTRGLMPAEKAQPTITWPEHVQVQRAARVPGRYEVLDAPGPFSATKPGQYAFEAQSCAARAVG